ncbi:MAG: DUF4965 domain-containing protein [Phycisphaeraceae bacterium]
MSWILARLGSRFSLLFEPHQRRIRQSALGRFLDEPVDLMVGLVEPDGTERVLPFSRRGTLLNNCEQFERLNSITFRGFSEKYRLRYEFNIHSVFYPQDESLCTMPAFYLEIRLTDSPAVRLAKPVGRRPKKIKLFIRLTRPGTEITASINEAGNGRIDLAYQAPIVPRPDEGVGVHGPDLPPDARRVQVHERIHSVTPGCVVDPDGKGLTLELPVTEEGSGVKWRLVWGAHCGDPVMTVRQGDTTRQARFKYASTLPSIDEVMKLAVEQRDDRLAHSRRFEKLMDVASLTASQRHLINQTFHAFLSNTYWLQLDDGAGNATDNEWFSVMEGNSFYHSTLDDEYNTSLFYLSIWPGLLAMQLEQWPLLERSHKQSGGAFLSHDMGRGAAVGAQAYDHDMPVEENCNYFLLLQAYAHWTGDLSIVQSRADLLERLAKYLIWTDADGSGFPSEGTPNTIDDAGPASQVARKQTYLAVKRLAALAAAGDLLQRVGRAATAELCLKTVECDVPKVERAAWLGDHYAVCVDKSSTGVIDIRTGESLPYDEVPGWDAYSIYTANGLLLPLMCGQPALFDLTRLRSDIYNAMRETLSPYGCGHNSLERDNVWVSQNLWRDHLGQYLGLSWPVLLSPRYWDLQVMSNTHEQSLGYVDTYIGNNLSFFPRGVTSIGYLFGHTRLVIDRLAEGGPRITVQPDRNMNQRYPLLPLADWKAGKIPTCVVDTNGRVSIESAIDEVVVEGGGGDE